MKEINVENKTYFLVLFDESTISIFEKNFKNVTEFKVKSIRSPNYILEKAISSKK